MILYISIKKTKNFEITVIKIITKYIFGSKMVFNLMSKKILIYLLKLYEDMK